MKLLVATRETQGDRDDDYCYTVEGELVTPIVFECDHGDECGCQRGFPGLASSRATTTARVADLPDFTIVQLWQALADSLERQGWLRLFPDPDERDDVIGEHVRTIRFICESLPEGAVVRRQGDRIMVA